MYQLATIQTKFNHKGLLTKIMLISNRCITIALLLLIVPLLACGSFLGQTTPDDSQPAEIDVEAEAEESAPESSEEEAPDDVDAGAEVDASNEPLNGLPVELDTPYRGISFGNDVDCFTFNIVEGNNFSVEVVSPADQPYETFARAELYDPQGNLITSDAADYGTSKTLQPTSDETEIPAPGVYAICLETYEFYPFGPYEFSINAIPTTE